VRHIWGAALLFSVFVGLAIASRGGPLPGDIRLLQIWPSSNGIISVINTLASVQVWTVLVVLTAAGLWLFGKRTAATWLVLADLSGEILAFLAKAIILRPRPSDAPLADALSTASFPSGHVMRATLSLGVLAFFFAWQRPAWRWPCTAAAGAVVLLIGAARVTSGEHWPTDVLAGYLLAGAWGEVLLIVMSLLA
jgi:undecaprenyl-diphosphatase